MNRITDTVESRLVRLTAGVFVTVVIGLTWLGVSVPASAGDEPPVDISIPSDSEDHSLRNGLQLESDGDWAAAIRHYESANRQFPQSKSLYQRLLISRLHFDVTRRYKDRSFLKSLDELNVQQALDLYAESLANLETHYVDPVEWSRVMLHGTAALEIALTETSFLQRNLPTADRNRVEQFRLTVHRKISDRPNQSRLDLRSNSAFVADLAASEIGLSRTATVLEFLGGAIATLDPYTRLLSGDQLDEMFSNIEGNFVGLGVELKAEKDSLRILSVIPGGPADEARLLEGESITRVDSSRTSEMDPDYVADLLRGPEQSSVSIAVRGFDGKERDLTLRRRLVEVPSVEHSRLIDPARGVAYMRVSTFQKTTTRDVERELWNLHRAGMKSLVIDVRGNPGGLLSAAVEVADRFLVSGRIVTTRGRNTRENFDYSAHRANTWSVPLVVLVDRESASASEIFAGAIADSGRGTLIGETSYGKGSVQGIFRMQTANFGLCLTTAKFYSPSGRAISHSGVAPHIKIEPTYIAARVNADGVITRDQDDSVLQKAIEHLTTVNVAARIPLDPQGVAGPGVASGR
jgi:carboxyl-terminal processing protease